MRIFLYVPFSITTLSLIPNPLLRINLKTSGSEFFNAEKIGISGVSVACIVRD